jgi:hypothetical protein
MAKPILVISIPYSVQNTEHIIESIEQIAKKLHDYHVLPYRASEIEELGFKVLNPGEAEDIDINALREELLNKIKNND